MDIVERLRAANFEPRTREEWELFRDAAAEIERLRKPARDAEMVHQQIFKAMHDRLDGKISDDLMSGAVWLGTEDAAKALTSPTTAQAA